MPETKTTIDKNAPILMQWIISDPNRLKKQAKEGRHPLPNTKTFPHRQRLVNMAKVEPDRLICLYYLGDTLDEKQNKQMEELENIAPNIRVIDFNKLDWSEYDFKFNTSMLSVEDEGEDMKMTEYLKLPNTDNRMGFRLDMMRSMMLLKGPRTAVLELKKVGTWDKPINKGGIYFDSDYVPDKKMGKLYSQYGLSAFHYDSHKNDFNYYNGIMAVTTDKNPILIDAHNNIKTYLSSDQPNLYEEFLTDVNKHYSYNKSLFKSKKTSSIIYALTTGNPDNDKTTMLYTYYRAFFFLNNYEDCRQAINLNMQKHADKSKASIAKIGIDYLKLALSIFQPYLTYIFVGNSLGKFIFNKASKEIKAKVDGAIDMNEKYKLMCELVATKENIQFESSHAFSIKFLSIEDKKCRSWTTSENLDVNKNLGSNTTYTEIFEMMYKNTELEVEKPATSLNDVRYEQQRENYRRSIS